MNGLTQAALSVSDIAKDLVVDPRTVRRWIRSGELSAIDCGSFYRVDRDVYRAWKKARETKTQGGGHDQAAV